MRFGRKWKPAATTIARLQALAKKLGLEIPASYVRYYHGHVQRAAGAWSWSATRESGYRVFGSCYPLMEILNADEVEISSHANEPELFVKNPKALF